MGRGGGRPPLVAVEALAVEALAGAVDGALQLHRAFRRHLQLHPGRRHLLHPLQ